MHPQPPLLESGESRSANAADRQNQHHPANCESD